MSSSRAWTHFALFCLILGLSVAVFLSMGNHRAPVGVLISIMGFVAAAITFRHEPQKLEKAFWIVLMTVLLVAEIRNLYLADAEQTKKLETVSGNLTTAVSGINTTIGNITGGDSYTYLVAEMGARPPFRLAVRVVGNYPVNNVAAEIQQFFGRDRDSVQRQIRSMHSVALGSTQFLPGFTPTNEVIPSGRFSVRVVSRNGDIREQIDLAQCQDGTWNEAIKMNGHGEKDNDTWKGEPGCHKPFE
jgi:hypothetical protein